MVLIIEKKRSISESQAQKGDPKAMCVVCASLDDFDEEYGIFTWSINGDWINIDEANLSIPDDPTTPLPEDVEEGAQE
jgi:hypothetical protein